MIEKIVESTFENVRLSTITGLDVVGIIQIVILLLIMFLVYFRLIKNTSSEKLVNGILASLVFLWTFSEVLRIANLNILSTFLKGLTITVILSLVVIFQPELRRFMGYLGQKNFLNNYFFGAHKRFKKENDVNVVKEILEAVKLFKKNKTGALIVLQNYDAASTYTEVGTKLNAVVSTPLLLTIFHPNTALHDGAVIIQDEQILAAGVLLPLTEDPKLSWRYGTRHRAAIGMSEVCDCACLVVSEETGDVSIAVAGSLKKYDDFTLLKADLENLLGVGDDNICYINSIFDIFGQKNKSEKL